MLTISSIDSDTMEEGCNPTDTVISVNSNEDDPAVHPGEDEQARSLSGQVPDNSALRPENNVVRRRRSSLGQALQEASVDAPASCGQLRNRKCKSKSVNVRALAMLATMLLGDIENSNVNDLQLILELQSETSAYSIFDITDDQGRTVIHNAAMKGGAAVLQLLLKYIADHKLMGRVDARDQYGNTALYLLCRHPTDSGEDHTKVQQLLDAGAEIKFIKKSDGMSVLHWACQHGSTLVVLALLGHLQSKRERIDFLYKKNAHQRLPLDLAGERYVERFTKWDQVTGGLWKAEGSNCVCSWCLWPCSVFQRERCRTTRAPGKLSAQTPLTGASHRLSIGVLSAELRRCICFKHAFHTHHCAESAVQVREGNSAGGQICHLLSGFSK